MKYSHGAFNVVIVNQRVLLVKRRDFPLWDLPGGDCVIIMTGA